MGRVSSILRRMYMFGKSSGSHAFKDAAYELAVITPRTLAKADHRFPWHLASVSVQSGQWDGQTITWDVPWARVGSPLLVSKWPQYILVTKYRWKYFLSRRSGFDEWSLERRKAGNTISGKPGVKCISYILTLLLVHWRWSRGVEGLRWLDRIFE